MTAEGPPPAPDWPASCGAAAAREGGGAEQGADCLPASPSSAPPRPPRKHGEPILAPREPGSRRRTEHAQQGPAGRGAPARSSGRGRRWRRLRALRAAIPDPGGLARTGAAGDRRACGRRSREPRAPRRALGGRRGHSSLGAQFALPFSKWRGRNAKMGVRGRRCRVTPRTGVRAGRSRGARQTDGTPGDAGGDLARRAEGAESERSGGPGRKLTRAFLACWVTAAGAERESGGRGGPRVALACRGCGAKSPPPAGAAAHRRGCLCTSAPPRGSLRTQLAQTRGCCTAAAGSLNCKLCLRKAGRSPVQLLPRAVDHFLSPGTFC